MRATLTRQRALWLALAFLPLTSPPAFSSPGSGSGPPGITLGGPLLQLVLDDAAFFPFARQLQDAADHRLRHVAPLAPAERKQLLGLRVHLALCLQQDDIALRCAKQLSAMQEDPGERAHAGLLTRAMVESKRDPTRLERILLAALQGLPRTAATRAAVHRAAQRLAGLSRASLLAEIQEEIEPRLAHGEPVTWETADQIVRVGHRLRNVLPLREPMLRAYDAALAAWER